MVPAHPGVNLVNGDLVTGSVSLNPRAGPALLKVSPVRMEASHRIAGRSWLEREKGPGGIEYRLTSAGIDRTKPKLNL